MGGTARSLRILVLLAAFAAPAVAVVRAGEAGTPGSPAGNPGRPPADKLMLSLHVARAMKDGRGIARYKSLARQRRMKDRRPPGGKTAPPLPRGAVTGRDPPAGR